jgi:hypothetical protein
VRFFSLTEPSCYAIVREYAPTALYVVIGIDFVSDMDPTSLCTSDKLSLSTTICG